MIGITKIEENQPKYSMVKNLEKFMESELNNIPFQRKVAYDIYNRMLDIFIKYGQISLGDVYDIVKTVKEHRTIGYNHAAPSNNYYNYGYNSIETGFKIRLTFICNTNPDFEKFNSVHILFEFGEAVNI